MPQLDSFGPDMPSAVLLAVNSNEAEVASISCLINIRRRKARR